MKFWPYETFEADIPRAAEDVAKALSTFAGAGSLKESLQYAPMSGTVTGLSFAILSKAYRDRSPAFYFYGDIRPDGDSSHVSVVLKCPFFPLIFGGGLFVVIIGLLYFVLRYPLGPDMIERFVPLPLFVLGILYLPYLISFWIAQTRKRDLVHVMTYYGRRARIDSVD